MGLRNVPTEAAADLAGMVACRPGQVSSMALTTVDCPTAATLLAFSAGEAVSEEAYASDMLYLGVEGAFRVVLPDGAVDVGTGQVLAVPSGVLHAVEGDGAFKVLQVAVG